MRAGVLLLVTIDRCCWRLVSLLDRFGRGSRCILHSRRFARAHGLALPERGALCSLVNDRSFGGDLCKWGEGLERDRRHPIQPAACLADSSVHEWLYFSIEDASAVAGSECACSPAPQRLAFGATGKPFHLDV